MRVFRGKGAAYLVACSVAEVTISLRSGRAARAFFVRPNKTSVLIVPAARSASMRTRYARKNFPRARTLVGLIKHDNTENQSPVRLTFDMRTRPSTVLLDR